MKRFLSYLTSLLLVSSLLIFTESVRADEISVGDPGPAWAIPNDAERGMHIQQHVDSFPGDSYSYLLDPNLRRDMKTDPTCKSVKDERCTNEQLIYSAMLPTCGPASTVYCIEEFGVVDEAGTRTPATFSRYFPQKALNEFVADTDLKVPFGAAGSIFSLPEARHGGSDNYYLSVLTQGGINKNSGARLGQFSIRISPIQLKPEDFGSDKRDPGWKTIIDTGSGNQIGDWVMSAPGFSGTSHCVATAPSENLCAQRYAFPAKKKFYVKVRMQQLPSGWMHGRIYQPEISIAQSSDYFTLDVSANPVAVPIVYKMYRYPQMPQALKDQYDVRTGIYKPLSEVLSEDQIQSIIIGGCGRSKCSEDPMTRNVINSPGPSEAVGMDQLKLWLPFVEDQATATLGTWSMRTLEAYELQGASQCFTSGDKGVTGIVTTNATQYSGGPPMFNREEGTLEYKVAAPHYTPQKAEFLGTYDLLMRSDVARCVYGFSNAPIKASLAIVNNGENQRIATENLGERNGWVFLSAAGFTFSDPTIKVKLTQDPPAPAPTPTPSATPTPTISASPPPATVLSPAAKANSKPVICIKGKKSKKYASGKCPKGWKKKA